MNSSLVHLVFTNDIKKINRYMNDVQYKMLHDDVCVGPRNLLGGG